MKHRSIKTISIFVMIAVIPICMLTFAAKGSDGINTVEYNAKNEYLQGEYKVPQKDGFRFVGWATTKENADAGEADFNPLPNDLSNRDLNSIKNGESKTLYAVWSKSNAKYAVSVFGINVDKEKQGGGTYNNTVTFGPALGANYVTTKKAAHIPKKAETQNNKCIHNHTWPEIISIAKTNPEVFRQCIVNGCTKTVELTINSTLRRGDWSETEFKGETGDGPSLLWVELQDQWIVWQYGGSDYNLDGWPARRIRAMMNGCDSYTNIRLANYGAFTNIESINNTNCLLSCFPQELQNAIVAKAVKSDIIWNDKENSNVTTYDKLWLFACSDFGGQSYFRPKEVTDYIAKGNTRIGDPKNDLGYQSDGASRMFWLRSYGGSSENYPTAIWHEDGRGVRISQFRYCEYYAGIAPGFVIGQ